MTVLEFIKKVENADNWNDIEVDEYKEYLSIYGIDYDKYDCPEFMWDDFLAVVKVELIKYIDRNSDYSYFYNDSACDICFGNGYENISIYDNTENIVNTIEKLTEFKNIVCD
jgi:hypothetical protein